MHIGCMPSTTYPALGAAEPKLGAVMVINGPPMAGAGNYCDVSSTAVGGCIIFTLGCSFFLGPNAKQCYCTSFRNDIGSANLWFNYG